MVVPYIGTWIETTPGSPSIEVGSVVPYIGTWIETWHIVYLVFGEAVVVPYIGTWIETWYDLAQAGEALVVPYIGTWIETLLKDKIKQIQSRTLYRYVD